MRRPCIDAELARAAARRAVPLLIGSLVASPVHAQQPLLTQPLDSASVVRLELARGGRVEAVLLAPFAPESSGGGLGLPLGLAATADDGPCVARPGAGCDQPSHLGLISLTPPVGAGI